MRSRRNRVRFAWCLLVGSVGGWAVTALTIAKDEPQVILAISWLAITLTAYDILTTSHVHEDQGRRDKAKTGE